MVRMVCDGCGEPLEEKGLRYAVTIDVRAVYEKVEVGLLDLVRDHRAELLALIGRLEAAEHTADEREETVYKAMRLDLCAPCQRAFIKAPLRFRASSDAGGDAIDIEGFLRSLSSNQHPDNESGPHHEQE